MISRRFDIYLLLLIYKTSMYENVSFFITYYVNEYAPIIVISEPPLVV